MQQHFDRPFHAQICTVVLSFFCTFGAVARSDDVLRLREAWASSGVVAAETDSVAIIDVGRGAVRVFATAKTGDRIDVFDARNGRSIRSFGKGGDGPGELRRPNGICAVHLKDVGLISEKAAAQSDGTAVIFVVERDNARVQAFDANSCEPLGIFGVGALTRPYGATFGVVDGRATLFVTDSKTPANKRVKSFAVALADGKIRAELLAAFGDESTRGEIRTPESIVYDGQRNRLLICDEDADGTTRNVKIYAADGRFSGVTFADGLIKGDPEGIVVLEAPRSGQPRATGVASAPAAGDSIILLTHQEKSLTTWLAFDAGDLRLKARLTGSPPLANTDGIAVYPHAFEGFPAGIMVAVDDDAELRGYDLAKLWGLIESGKSSE